MGLERIIKQDLNDPDNHDGVIAHLEPDILESEVKWALGSIIANKPSGGDGIPFELFHQSLCTEGVQGKLIKNLTWARFRTSLSSQDKQLHKI